MTSAPSTQSEQSTSRELLTPQAMQAKIGEELGVSEWLCVEQAMIDEFADATHDHQWIHIDLARAEQSPFGSTIAHGFLLLSLLPHLTERSSIPAVAGVTMGLNYGCNRVRFTSPVRAGKRVRARHRLLGLKEKRAGQWEQCVEVTMEIEGETKPALVAEWIHQFFV